MQAPVTNAQMYLHEDLLVLNRLVQKLERENRELRESYRILVEQHAAAMLRWNPPTPSSR